MHEEQPELLEGLQTSQPLARSAWKRALYIALGSLLTGIGILGIFLPLLPSTVFFLMAAGCFGKSSPSAYRWLTTNRLFGEQLRHYKEHKGATIRSKVISVSTLWLGIATSAYFFHLPLWVDALLAAIAVAVSIHLVRLQTIRTSPAQSLPNTGVSPSAARIDTM